MISKGVYVMSKINDHYQCFKAHIYRKELVMNNEQLLSRLEDLNAQYEFIDWVADKRYSLVEVWRNCHRGDWMLWLAYQRDIDKRLLMAAKVQCAQLAQFLIKDIRFIEALKLAIVVRMFYNSSVIDASILISEFIILVSQIKIDCVELITNLIRKGGEL